MRSLLTATVVLASALAACGGDDSRDATPTTTTTVAESTSTSAERSTTTAGVEEPEVVDGEAVVREWIGAIAAGDDDAAIALTAPRSLEAIGGPDGFAASEVALAEGWGAWHRAEDLEVHTVELAQLAATAVVVLHGSVAQEGPPEERWTAVPVVATADGDRVEPFLDLGPVEVDPPGDTEVAPSPDFSAYVLGGREVAVLLDDEPVRTTAERADGDRRRVSYEASSPTMSPGRHGLTVVVWTDAAVMTRTFTYAVEG